MLSAACGTGGVDAAAEHQVACVLEVAATLLRGDPRPVYPEKNVRGFSSIICTTASEVTPASPRRGITSLEMNR